MGSKESGVACVKRTVKPLTTVPLHFTRSDATSLQGSKVVFVPIRQVQCDNESKQTGALQPIPLRPARTTLALTRCEEQGTNGCAIEQLPQGPRHNKRQPDRAAVGPEDGTK